MSAPSPAAEIPRRLSMSMLVPSVETSTAVTLPASGTASEVRLRDFGLRVRSPTKKPIAAPIPSPAPNLSLLAMCFSCLELNAFDGFQCVTDLLHRVSPVLEDSRDYGGILGISNLGLS